MQTVKSQIGLHRKQGCIFAWSYANSEEPNWAAQKAGLYFCLIWVQLANKEYQQSTLVDRVKTSRQTVYDET